MSITFIERALVAVLLLVAVSLGLAALAIGRPAAFVLCVVAVIGALYIVFCGGDFGADAQGDFAFADRIQQREPERNRIHLDRDG
ncbi:hypothetical protein ABL850_14825 [Variovorax paradoxus]|uniref:hypothetical protein n=1 Tax=Variovorax paradoxus TaxID=34073 RepID=UPI00047F0D83